MGFSKNYPFEFIWFNSTLGQNIVKYDITIVGLNLPANGRTGNGNDVTAAHFHSAPAGVNGPVVFGLISPNHDLDDLMIDPVAGTVSGAWEETDNNGNAPLSSELANLLADGLYLNFHTTPNPGGEIRGQILCGGVPTVGPVGLWVLTLLLLSAGGFLLWKRANLTRPAGI